VHSDHSSPHRRHERVLAGSFNYTQPANDENIVLGSVFPKIEKITANAPCKTLATHLKGEIDS
jgi:hypothetical protein